MVGRTGTLVMIVRSLIIHKITINGRHLADIGTRRNRLGPLGSAQVSPTPHVVDGSKQCLGCFQTCGQSVQKKGHAVSVTIKEIVDQSITPALLDA